MYKLNEHRMDTITYNIPTLNEVRYRMRAPGPSRFVNPPRPAPRPRYSATTLLEHQYRYTN